MDLAKKAWLRVALTLSLYLLGFATLASCGIGLAPSARVLPSVSGATSIPNQDGTVTVTISGSGFVTGVTVTVNGTACTNVNVLSSSHLTCVLPSATIALANIVITSPDGSSGGSSSATSPLISSTAVSATDGGGATAAPADTWINLTNALSNDGASTTLFSPNQDETTSTLVLKGFLTLPAQKIPVTATVTGIKLTCFWHSDWDFGTAGYVSSIKLINGTTTGAEKTTTEDIPMTTAATSQAYGGANDTWGLSLTPAIVNSASFGVQIQLKTGIGSAKYLYVDYCTLTAYFTP